MSDTILSVLFLITFDMAKKEINYFETFSFADIPYPQVFPVYSVSESGKIYNIRSIIQPSPKSKKKFTRNKQLSKRSMQAKIVDALINIGYFENLIVIPEFPVIIQNSLRLPGQSGGYYLLDYFFPQLSLSLELDSDYHDPGKDSMRDQYLESIGIKTFRIMNLEKPQVQKTKFKEFISLLQSLTPQEKPKIFDFLDNIRAVKNTGGGIDLGLWKVI